MLATPALILSSTAKADTPHQVRFLHGGFDGARYQGGLMIRMLPGWKTYWRVPGAGGIPPVIEATGTNLGSFRFDCPLPYRLSGADGESIGYKDEVIFPFELTPVDATAPVAVTLSAFVGVCETICIPVQAQEQVELKPVAMATRDAAVLLQWRARVPQVTEAGPILSATAGEAHEARFVDLKLARPLRDIFVEGSALHFFAAPRFHADGLAATIAVHGAKSVADLLGHDLRITIDDEGRGLEQMLRVV